MASEGSWEPVTHMAVFGWKLTKALPFTATSKKTWGSEPSSGGSSQPTEQLTVRGTMERGGESALCLLETVPGVGGRSPGAKGLWKGEGRAA